MVGAFEREIAPPNIFEKLEARDISHKVVEEQLLKGMQTAIVRSARVKSLAMLLGPTYGQNTDKAFKVAQDYALPKIWCSVLKYRSKISTPMRCTYVSLVFMHWTI